MLGHELEEAIIIENDSEFLFDYDHLELNLCSIAVERYLSLSKIALERSRQDFEFRRYDVNVAFEIYLSPKILIIFVMDEEWRKSFF